MDGNKTHKPRLHPSCLRSRGGRPQTVPKGVLSGYSVQDLGCRLSSPLTPTPLTQGPGTSVSLIKGTDDHRLFLRGVSDSRTGARVSFGGRELSAVRTEYSGFWPTG